MKLVSLKRDAAEKADDHACSPCSSESPDYPYGTCLYLDEDQLDKLGIDSMPAAGASVGIEAIGTVKGVREEQVDGKVKRSLEIQVTDLALAMATKSMAERMYGKKD